MAEKITIIVDAKDQASGVLGGISKALGGIATVAGGILTANVIQDVGRALFDLGKDSINAASDLSETWNKVGVVFGTGAGDIEDFVNDVGTQLGQSKQQMLDAASTFGVFGKSAGLTDESLANFSTDLLGLSSDLASFYNTSPEEAIQAIGAALRGESEPIRRFGVLLDDATLRQKALEMGLIKTTKNALTPQQKVLAANAVIMEQTSDAQGDFMRTSDGLANSQRIIAAQWADMKTQLGAAFLPAVQAVSNVISTKLLPIGLELIDKFITPAGPAVQGFIDGLMGILENGIQMPAILQPLGDAFGNLFTAISDSAPMVIETLRSMWGFLVQTFQTMLPTIIENLTGTVNTIAEIWRTHGDTIMAVISAAWQAIVIVIMGALTFISGIIQVAVLLIQTIMDGFSLMLQGRWDELWLYLLTQLQEIFAVILETIETVMNTALDIFGTNLEAVRAVWSNNLNMLVTIVTDVFNRIVAFIRGMVGTFRQMAVELVEGFKSSFNSAWRNMLDWVMTMIGQLPDAVKSILGISSPSKVFAEIGLNVMRGFGEGINQGAGIPAMAMSGAVSSVVNNSYNLTINEAGTRGNVVGDFNLMKSMARA